MNCVSVTFIFVVQVQNHGMMVFTRDAEGGLQCYTEMTVHRTRTGY